MSKLIPLSGQHGQGHSALVNDSDYETLNNYTWHLGNNGYVKTFVGGRKNLKCLLMHRLIMNPPDDHEVDHISGDPLDNRRENLRIVTRSQNARNLRRHKQFSSRFKGVGWNARRSIWEVKLTLNGRSIYSGQFTSELEAAHAYNAAAIKHFGEFASLNEITPDMPDDVRYRQGKGFVNGRSQYRGVSFCKNRQKWTAEIMINGKRLRLGGFDTEKAAAQAYDAAALQHRGTNAYINFPEDVPK